MRLLFATSLALLLNRCLADTPPVKDTTSAPGNPGLNYLMSVNATVGVVYDFGTGPYGKREIATITGGTVTGPKLSGKVCVTLIYSGDVDASLNRSNEAMTNPR